MSRMTSPTTKERTMSVMRTGKTMWARKVGDVTSGFSTKEPVLITVILVLL